MSANLDLVRSIVAAWARGDFSSTEWADPEIEYVFHDGPEPGRWRGVTEMGEATRDFLRAWERFRWVADEYRELEDGQVVVLTHNTGRGRTSGIEIEQIWGGRGALLARVRDGKVARLDVYFDRDRALADLGLEA